MVEVNKDGPADGLDSRCGFNAGSALDEPKTEQWLSACESLAARFDHWKMPDRAAQIRAGHPGWLIEHACIEALVTLQAERDRYRVALEPSAETKAAYIGEFKFTVVDRDEDGDEVYRVVAVPWDTIKEIMAAIRARTALSDTPTVQS